MRFSRIDSPLSGLRQSWLDFSGLSPNGSKFDYSPRGSASKQVPQIRVINNSRWFASKYGKAFWINSPFRQASKSLSTTRTKFWELHILQLIAKHVSNFGATGTSKLMIVPWLLIWQFHFCPWVFTSSKSRTVSRYAAPSEIDRR